MQKLDPVNPTPPIPRSPPVHRDKRRRESEPPIDNSAKPEKAEAEDRDTQDDNDHTIDEYA